MKRDIDLIRKILFEIEEKANGLNSFTILIDGYESSVVGYHNKIIVESGLAVAVHCNTMSSEYPEYIMKDLTPEGHDFLDAVRSEDVWKSTKSKIEKVGSWTLDIVKQVAVAAITQKLNLK